MKIIEWPWHLHRWLDVVKELEIENPEVVVKSYPGYWMQIKKW